MATKNRNNILEDVNFAGKRMRWPLSTGGSYDFNQGDLMAFIAGSPGYVKAVSSATEAGLLVGVAEKPAFLSLYTAQNLAAGPGISKSYEPDALVIYGCLASFYMDTSDSAQTYYDGNPVYFATDAQHITKQATSPANSVGIVKLPSASIASGLAYSVGGLVTVLVIAQYPIAAL